METLSELAEALSELEKNREVKVVVITGEGKAFADGAEVLRAYTGRQVVLLRDGLARRRSASCGCAR